MNPLIVPQDFIASMTAYLRMFLRNATQLHLPGLDVTREQLQPLAASLYTVQDLTPHQAKETWVQFWETHSTDLLRTAHSHTASHLGWIDVCHSTLRTWLAGVTQMGTLTDKTLQPPEDLDTYLDGYFRGMLPKDSVIHAPGVTALALLLRRYTLFSSDARATWEAFWLQEGWKFLPRLRSGSPDNTALGDMDTQWLTTECLRALEVFLQNPEAPSQPAECSDVLDRVRQPWEEYVRDYLLDVCQLQPDSPREKVEGIKKTAKTLAANIMARWPSKEEAGQILQQLCTEALADVWADRVNSKYDQATQVVELRRAIRRFGCLQPPSRAAETPSTTAAPVPCPAPSTRYPGIEAVWLKVMTPHITVNNCDPAPPPAAFFDKTMSILQACYATPRDVQELLGIFGALLSFELNGWWEKGFADHELQDVRVVRVVENTAWLYIHRVFEGMFTFVRMARDTEEHPEAVRQTTYHNLKLLVYQAVEFVWFQQVRLGLVFEQSEELDGARTRVVRELALPLAEELGRLTTDKEGGVRTILREMSNCHKVMAQSVEFNPGALHIYAL